VSEREQTISIRNKDGTELATIDVYGGELVDIDIMHSLDAREMVEVGERLARIGHGMLGRCAVRTAAPATLPLDEEEEAALAAFTALKFEVRALSAFVAVLACAVFALAYLLR
jgi:hypothetical protein